MINPSETLAEALKSLDVAITESKMMELRKLLYAAVDHSVAQALLSQNMALAPLLKDFNTLKNALKEIAESLDVPTDIKEVSLEKLISMHDICYFKALNALRNVRE